MQEKYLTKLKNLFMLKLLRILKIEGGVLSAIKGIYNKPRANILFNGETMVPTLRNKATISTPTPFWDDETYCLGWLSHKYI